MFNWSIADMKNMCFHIGIQLFVVWNSKKRPFKRKLIEAPTWLSRSSPRSIWKEEYKVATCAYEKTVCGKFGAPKKFHPIPNLDHPTTSVFLLFWESKSYRNRSMVVEIVTNNYLLSVVNALNIVDGHRIWSKELIRFSNLLIGI